MLLSGVDELDSHACRLFCRFERMGDEERWLFAIPMKIEILIKGRCEVFPLSAHVRQYFCLEYLNQRVLQLRGYRPLTAFSLGRTYRVPLYEEEAIDKA